MSMSSKPTIEIAPGADSPTSYHGGEELALEHVEGIGYHDPNHEGPLIYTQSGYYAWEFARRSHGGMVGVNVGIPVPLGVFGFTGHKHSFFGDLHAMGMDGVRFFTELKGVTTHWFSDAEAREDRVSNSWDGMISMPGDKR